jgi:hypothetical protein
MVLILIAIRRTKFIIGKLAKRAFVLSVAGLSFLEAGEFFGEI